MMPIGDAQSGTAGWRATVTDWCDYCHEELPDGGALIRVPGRDEDGNIMIQLHCGKCEPGDTEDLAAKAEFVNRIGGQR